MSVCACVCAGRQVSNESPCNINCILQAKAVLTGVVSRGPNLVWSFASGICTLYVCRRVCVCVCVLGASAKCRVLIACVCLTTTPLNSHFSSSSSGPPCSINWLSVVSSVEERHVSDRNSLLFFLPKKHLEWFFFQTWHSDFFLLNRTHFVPKPHWAKLKLWVCSVWVCVSVHKRMCVCMFLDH